jgi:hypothetical protein
MCWREKGAWPGLYDVKPGQHSVLSECSVKAHTGETGDESQHERPATEWSWSARIGRSGNKIFDQPGATPRDQRPGPVLGEKCRHGEMVVVVVDEQQRAEDYQQGWSEDGWPAGKWKWSRGRGVINETGSDPKSAPQDECCGPSPRRWPAKAVVRDED